MASSRRDRLSVNLRGASSLNVVELRDVTALLSAGADLPYSILDSWRRSHTTPVYPFDTNVVPWSQKRPDTIHWFHFPPHPAATPAIIIHFEAGYYLCYTKQPWWLPLSTTQTKARTLTCRTESQEIVEALYNVQTHPTFKILFHTLINIYRKCFPSNKQRKLTLPFSAHKLGIASVSNCSTSHDLAISGPTLNNPSSVTTPRYCSVKSRMCTA